MKGKKIGSGGFSKVYEYTGDDFKNAVIKIPNTKYNSRRKIHYLKYEISILEYFKTSNNVINMLKYHIEPYNSFIVLEKLGGSLYDLIYHNTINNIRMNLDDVKKYSRYILEAIDEIHKCGILHGDIRPENILFNGDKIKIIDFGNSLYKKDFSNRKMYPRGTRYYRPPEWILYADYDFSADLWAFGCIVYEMLTNKCLFDPQKDGMSVNAQHIGMIIKTLGPFSPDLLNAPRAVKYFDLSVNPAVYKYNYLLGRPQNIATILYKYFDYDKKTALEIHNFLKPILCIDPKLRCTVAECLNHDFLKNDFL